MPKYTYEEIVNLPLVDSAKDLVRGLRIGLGDGEDPRMKEAAAILSGQLGAKVTLYASHPAVLADVNCVSPNEHTSDKYLTRLLELRTKRGLTAEDGRILLNNPLYIAALALERDELDVAVSGSLSTTADVIRVGLHCIKRTTSTVSSCFLMQMPSGQELIFSDCGVIPYPSAEQLADIAEASVLSYGALIGGVPKVAFLSFSTRSSATHEKVELIQSAVQLFKARCPGVLSDGELQLDAAIVPEIAVRKCNDSPLKGDANILIFPNLDAGNIAYKAVERFGGAKAIGPLLQGFAKPWLDLSRGCSVLDIVSVAAAGALFKKHLR